MTVTVQDHSSLISTANTLKACSSFYRSSSIEPARIVMYNNFSSRPTALELPYHPQGSLRQRTDAGRRQRRQMPIERLSLPSSPTQSPPLARDSSSILSRYIAWTKFRGLARARARERHVRCVVPCNRDVCCRELASPLSCGNGFCCGRVEGRNWNGWPDGADLTKESSPAPLRTHYHTTQVKQARREFRRYTRGDRALTNQRAASFL